LAAAIKGKILEGEFKEGEYIPSEPQLSQMFNISRTTVRQALQKLCNDGLLERQRGKGTIVVMQRKKLSRQFPGWSSFTEETKRMGKNPGTLIVSVDAIIPPDEIAAALQLEHGEKAIYMLRKRYADDELLGVSESYFNRSVLDSQHIQMMNLFELNNRSIYAFLEERGIELVWANESIEAGAVDKKVAKILGIVAGAPMLYLTRVVYGPDDVPIEYAINKFRGDKYKISIVHNRY
jgi:GntR family transcriptional regulator